MPGKISEKVWQARFDKFVVDATAKYGDKFVYHRDKWFGLNKPATIVCSEHGDFQKTPCSFLEHKYGCPKCADAVKGKWNSISIDEVFDRIHQMHSNTYLYDRDEYVDFSTKITITCRMHGKFKQSPQVHSGGQGCPKCGQIKTRQQKMMPFDTFIKLAKELKGELIDNFKFHKNEWKGSETHTAITCKKHGLMTMRPCDFLGSKYGCTKCADEISGLARRTPDSVLLNNLKKTFPQFEYSNIQRVNGKTKVDIICSKHGVFTKSYHKFLNCGKCPGCSKNKQYSGIGTKWLESLNIETLIYEYRLPEKLYQAVDGYDPVTNTVYQFHGDFWHGNPKFHNPDDINPRTKERFGAAYERTLRLDNEIQDLGYNLIVMWQSDFMQGRLDR